LWIASTIIIEDISMPKIKGSTSWDNAIAPHVKGSGASQAGFQSRKGIKTVAPKSYSGNRERQLFRQISTRLYFHAREKAKKKGLDNPVEIQMMRAGSNVFIGSNEDDTALTIHKTLSYTDTTRKALVDKSYFATRKSAGGRITSRHASKLESRMFDEGRQKKWVKGGKGADAASRTSAAYSATLLRTVEPEYLDMTDKKAVKSAFKSQGKVFVVHSDRTQEGRHVEEKFMDLLETSGHKTRTVIGGKMRPCLTCSGRMSHTKSEGHDVDFGSEPGKIWKGRYEAQPKDVRKSTAKLAQTKHTFKSSAGFGYEAESDSDGD
jgi:hypothetical protein